MEQLKERIHWELLVASGVMLLGIVAVNIILFIHLDSKTNNLIESIRQDIKEGKQEMRDFHEQLIRIEERRQK